MELLTVQETADLLNVAPITLRRYIADGRLPVVRIGRSVRVRKESLGRLMRPVKVRKRAKRRERILPGRPSTMDDPLWNIVGLSERLGVTDRDGATDVSSNKHKYLADAYTAEATIRFEP